MNRSLTTPRLLTAWAIAFLAICGFGCASTYKPVSTKNIVYMDTKTVSDSIRVSYRYGVQDLSNNRRYGAKERKRSMAAVAVKIENVSPVPLTLTRSNFKVTSGNGDKRILSPMAYSTMVRQRVGAHMLHALWGPWAITWSEDEYGNRDVGGFYLPVGLIVGIGNATRASNANKKHLSTLEQLEIWNKEIPPGETLYGIITIPANSAEEQLGFAYGKNLTTEVDPTPLSPYTPKSTLKSPEFKFYVWPIEGLPFDALSRIHINEEKHYVMSKGVRIYPKDTKSLSRVTSSGRQLLGLPDGDQWLFKVIEGPINGYFFLAEDQPTAVTKIQKGDGPVVEFTPSVLAGMVEGDPDVLDLIQKREFIAAIVMFNGRKRSGK